MGLKDRERRRIYDKTRWDAIRAANGTLPLKPCACGCGALVKMAWAKGHARRAIRRETDSTQRCTGCGQWLPFDAFHSSAHRKNGLEPRCKTCFKAKAKQWHATRGREKRLAKLYGVTVEWYDAQVAKQGGLCAVCQSPERAHDKAPLVVDHCHDTGVVRGLLCLKCNTGIGMLGDDVMVVQRASRYVTSFWVRRLVALPGKPSVA